MKTIKSLIRLASNYWWCYNKHREQKVIRTAEEFEAAINGMKVPPCPTCKTLDPLETYIGVSLIKLDCPKCGKCTSQQVPLSINKVYIWCQGCNYQNDYARLGIYSFKCLSSKEVTVEAKWMSDERNPQDVTCHPF